jgi:hypothetical protein
MSSYQPQQPNYSQGPPQFRGQFGIGDENFSMFDPDTKLVKASMAPGDNYPQTHNAGSNRSQVRFVNNLGWESIPNVDSRCARLLNSAQGNAEDFDIASMVYGGSKFRPTAMSQEYVPKGTSPM